MGTDAQQHDETADLRLALETRDVIGQAKGILMERHGISADEAFDRLTKVSQDTNTKVRDIAAMVTGQKAADGQASAIADL